MRVGLDRLVLTAVNRVVRLASPFLFAVVVAGAAPPLLVGGVVLPLLVPPPVVVVFLVAVFILVLFLGPFALLCTANDFACVFLLVVSES